MLKDRLNSLMDSLDVNATTLAKYCDFDRSNISRIKNGSRTPSRNGRTIQKLSEGIIRYCKESNKIDSLKIQIQAKNAEEPEILNTFLSYWLCEDIHDDIHPITVSNTDDRHQHLNIAMQLAEVSNIYLSKILHIDPSLISRYRHGLRTLTPSNSASSQLCSVLWEHIQKNHKINDLSEAMKITSGSANYNEFKNWILSDTAVSKANIAFTENFLSTFNKSSDLFKILSPSFSDFLSDDVLNDDSSYYIGYEGFRQAVIRFLVTAIQSNSSQLLLYSDQSMDWMVADSKFRSKWLILMRECLKAGIHINIVHNIDRSLTEMGDAITSWLPLYMSGLVESYYCNRQRNSRFSHTVFINPGVCAIEAFNVVGTEQNGLYNYYTDAPLIDKTKDKFNKLKESCLPLLKVNPPIPEHDTESILMLENTSKFPTMRILISPSLIRIEHKSIPNLSFGFTHPLMCRAFISYAENLDETTHYIYS